MTSIPPLLLNKMLKMESRKRQRMELTSTSAPACSSLGEGHAYHTNEKNGATGSDNSLHQEALIMSFMRELEEQAQALQQLLDNHAAPEDLGNARLAASAAEVVTYSHKLCYTTFAPPAYQAGVTVLHNFRPPMPQEWQLRASQLHAREKKQERPPLKSDHAATNSSGHELGATNTRLPQAPQEKEAVLPELPPMPAGWKPGDPIPGDTAGVPAGSGATTSKESDKPSDKHTELPMFELILNPEWEDAEEEFSDEDTDE